MPRFRVKPGLCPKQLAGSSEEEPLPDDGQPIARSLSGRLCPMSRSPKWKEPKMGSIIWILSPPLDQRAERAFQPERDQFYRGRRGGGQESKHDAR